MKRLINSLKSWLVPVLVLLNLAVTLPLASYLNIWGDEAYTLHTTGDGLGRALSQALHFELQAPLYFLLLSLWRKVDGSIFWARLFSVVCIALTVKISFELARRFFRGVHPGWVAACVALHPFAIWAAVEARVYAFVILLSALLLLLFFDGYLAERTERRARVLYIITAITALYTHYYLGFLLVACAAALLVLKRWRALLSYMLAMAAVALAFAPMLVVVRRQMTVNVQAAARQVSFLQSLKIISWRVQEYALPAGWEPLQFVRMWLVRALLVVVVALAIMRRIRTDQKLLAVWSIWIVLCGFYVAALLLTEESLMQARHAAGLFVPTLLLVFSLIAAVGSRKILLAWVCLSAIFYALFLYGFYTPLAKQGDWRRVASFITATEKPNQPVLVFRGSAALPLSFYYSGQNALVPVPAGEDFDSFNLHDEVLASEEQIERALRERSPSEHDEMWLVTDETCRYLDIDFRCDILEEFVAKNYETLESRSFFGSRVRLLKKK